MLRTQKTPPPLGSVRESVLLLALMMEQNTEHAKFRALAAIQLDPKEGVEAFEDYMKVAFPYLETQKKRDRQPYIELLNQETERGPLVVAPLETPKLRSRMKARQRTVDLTHEEEQSLYSKMGSM